MKSVMAKSVWSNRLWKALFLIQRHILKIRRIAVGFLVVELIDAHIGFLDFLGSIAEGIGDMHGDGHDDDHFGCKHRAVYSFDPLGPYFEYFAHVC